MSADNKPSKLSRIIQHTKKVTHHLRGLPDQQQEFKQADQHLLDLHLNLNHRHEALKKDFADLKAYDESLRLRLQSLDERLTDALHQLTVVSERKAAPGASTAQPVSSDESLMANEHLLDRFYVHFERWFRGTEADIKKLQAEYLPLFTASTIDASKYPVLDIGCGNGEFVELLHENGIRAIGLDLNQTMIERVKEKGLEGVQADALDYLRAQKSNSLMAVTGFHIVEHIPFIDLVKLANECYRVLRPGGFILFETPNPENVIVGSCNFYNDPSHLHPLPPAFLELVIKTRGFSTTEIRRLHPLKKAAQLKSKDPLLQEIAEHMYGPQDYSVIGHK